MAEPMAPVAPVTMASLPFKPSIPTRLVLSAGYAEIPTLNRSTALEGRFVSNAFTATNRRVTSAAAAAISQDVSYRYVCIHNVCMHAYICVHGECIHTHKSRVRSDNEHMGISR